MEYILVLLALICAICGLAGAILPVIPGPPLSFAGLLLLRLCDNNDIDGTTIIIYGIAAVVITLLDYIAPIWLTKKTGGSKYGTWGAGIGMLVGLFMGPWGIITGPFLGALAGELIAKTPANRAIRTALMSFAAFMLTTGLKFIYGIMLLIMIAIEGWKTVWQ
ncbi:MAG: DUF456 domain-containing protein [Bacteroidaceae bacterium]|nr:DUF456 domain-containing protein [Bacteroidaceae bacterium]